MAIGIWQTAAMVLAPILFVLFMVLIIGVPAAAIATDKSNRTMGRKSFRLWFLGTFLFFVLMALVLLLVATSLNNMEDPGFGWVVILFTVVLSILSVTLLPWILARRVLWRARAAGWDPDLSYIFAVPIVRSIIAVALLFAPPASPSIESPLADRLRR